MNKSLKFSHKILLVAALIVVSAFSLFTLYNNHLQRDAIEKQLSLELKQTSAGTALTIQSWLSGRMLLIADMAEALTTAPTTQTRLLALQHKTLLSAFISVYLGQEDRSFVSEPPDEMPADYDPRTRPWYEAAQTALRPTLTAPYYDAVTKGLLITIAAPIKSAAGSGVAAGDLSLDTLEKLINSLKVAGNGHAFLVDSSGKILVHPDASLVMKSLTEIYPNNTPPLATGLNETRRDGRDRIVTFAHVDGLEGVNWYLGLEVDKDEAFAPLRKLQLSGVVATVVTVALVIGLLGLVLKILLRPLQIMGAAMNDIAQGEGDLTKRLAAGNRDEFGVLATHFNQFVDRIHKLIMQVSVSTQNVTGIATQVVTATHSSMQSTDDQVGRTASVAAAINELDATAEEIAVNAANASTHSRDVRRMATEGQGIIGLNIEAMSSLSDKLVAAGNKIELLNSQTANIGQILEVIGGISQQTNLLALNAAIEAARAGEAGRGFAVVADEVRSLAHRTQESALQVQKMIEGLQQGAREAVAIMNDSQVESAASVSIANKAGEHLSNVVARISQIDSMNHSVAAATEEQTAVVENINAEITEIDGLNQRGAESLQLTLDACRDLQAQSRQLRTLVARFKI